MYRLIKRFIAYSLTICLLFPVLCTLLATLRAEALSAVGSASADSKSTISSKTNYTLMSGVTESTVALTGGDRGYMLQIAPTAKAELKVSYSKYFTQGSLGSTIFIWALPAKRRTLCTTGTMERSPLSRAVQLQE